jgi:predicted RNase H-like HicB family nuclease
LEIEIFRLKIALPFYQRILALATFIMCKERVFGFIRRLWYTMIMSLKFTITYRKEGRWYVAYCPDLGVTSQGKTLEEAQANIQEAVELYLEDTPKEDLERFTGTPLVKTMEINKA